MNSDDGLPGELTIQAVSSADGTAGGTSRPKPSGKTTNGTSDNKKVAELERRLADVSLDGKAWEHGLMEDDFSARSIPQSKG